MREKINDPVKYGTSSFKLEIVLRTLHQPLIEILMDARETHYQPSIFSVSHKLR